MNQTRVFLIFAWLMVATLLWMEWGKEQAASSAPATPVAIVPGATAPTATAPGAIPLASVPGQATAAAAPAMTSAAPTVTVRTDVLKLSMDGGTLHVADLLKHPSTADEKSAPVRLLDSDAARYFAVSSGWINAQDPAQRAVFVPEGDKREFALAAGQDTLEVPFVWHGPNGISIRRTYVFTRGLYTVKVRDEVSNTGSTPWQGYVYRQLERVPRALQRSGPTSAEQYSFQGAAWFSPQDKYEKRKFDDFVDDGPLNKEVTGGWLAMLQHHYFAAWIPQPDQAALFGLNQANGRYTIEAKGPAFTVAPGSQVSTEARLWVGPKLVSQIEAQQVPGLERAVDFSSYSLMATLAGWLFWVLAKLYGVFGNWGWAIVGLVVLIKLAMYPLSAAQYKSMAKMRKFQPRIAQLKERYGDDKQKFQMAMMELYKKEKINPVGGCLPILLQMPVFLALYWMLSESVELRHAPWILWIHDLTARDPFFILPAINLAVMWATQKLTPVAPGMDPMQQKMMQWMPVVFGVMFAFFPAGLVLYWVTNGALGLLQQWWMTKRYSEEPAKT
ncbi:YidC/Oxa1 family membrane protein insertase [Luteimonas cucumeris]|uniref:Membrane protein insertase YidC n=1 Tax=Luteimonas cucumeris TaxID=985012 RepID=A0A562KVP7_9GAMM|nr:membrane protein insertase YidC [Luteimonas cucumeris]TWH99499.1 YidC/Oxa1 family membrane protein insertase [Luteimonas cucumeris]